MSILLISYILVPIAFVLMLKNYKTSNWVWLAVLIASIFVGVAPFVALAYLVTYFVTKSKNSSAQNAVYRPDGSYTMYTAAETKNAPSAGKTAFRVIGGIIAGLAVTFGLFIVFIIIALATYKPPAGSKTM